MCGIAALLLAPSTPQLEHILHNYAPRITSTLQPRGPDVQGSKIVTLPAATTTHSDAPSSAFPFLLAASVLHLRGATPAAQPFTASDSATSPVLCFNGEIYSGLPDLLTPHTNDTAALYHHLATATTPDTSPLHLLSTLDGEYAFTYYQPASSTLWFGKDPMGRRSLLAAFSDECGLCVSSVVLDTVNDTWQHTTDWTELPTSGLFSVDVRRWAETAVLEIWLHYWPHIRRAYPVLPDKKMIRAVSDALLHPTMLPFPRTDLLPSQPTARLTPSELTVSSAAERLDELLSASVRERVITCPPPSEPSDAAVAVLFSGGLDCTLLAHYAHLHTPLDQPIDLINVAFIGQLPPSSAIHHCPDRITAYNSLLELKHRHPHRHYRLLCVDVSLAALEAVRSELMGVLRPCVTVMDFNIGVVLWFGAMGAGYVVERVDGWIDSRYGRYRTEGGSDVAEAVKGERREVGREEKVEMRVDEVHAMDSVLATDDGDDKRVSADMADDSGLSEEEKLHRANPLYGYKRTPAARKANTLRRKQLAKQQRHTQRQLAATTNNNHHNDAADEPESTPTAAEFDAASSEQPPGPLYTTRARVLLVGIGADEMFAGYARHRTTLRSTGAIGLSHALSVDVGRLWLRNHGRDDRATAHHARELRTPFLSAPLLHYWQHVPLDCLHTLPSVLGGKAVLREVGRQAGLVRVSGLEKRAMQFGSRISNRRVVGWVRMTDTVAVREVVNPLLLREECRPSSVRGEIEKREAKKERDRRGREKEVVEDESSKRDEQEESSKRDEQKAERDTADCGG